MASLVDADPRVAPYPIIPQRVQIVLVSQFVFSIPTLNVDFPAGGRRRKWGRRGCRAASSRIPAGEATDWRRGPALKI